MFNIFVTGTSTSTTDRDAGFCSGGDDDELEVEDDIHSPTDASEDSVEVKVTPISLRNKNKRKCAEPRKVNNDELPSGPLKKRIRFEQIKQQTEADNQSPFRPWSIPARPTVVVPQVSPRVTIPHINTPPPTNFHPVYGYQMPTQHQEEPLALVKSRPESPRQRRRSEPVPETITRPTDYEQIPLKIETQIPRVPPHPGVRPPMMEEMEQLTNIPKTSPGFSVESLLSSKASQKDKCSEKPQKEQRNYKNMTRERRIEANARERTRVHTISAAFDTLRRSIPAYSHNQKLSKLSVLRIACSYILTLSRVAGDDYSADQSSPSLASCVDLVSRTIQTEGKLRKKKDES